MNYPAPKQSSSAAETTAGTTSAHEILSPMLDNAEEAAALAGGSWSYDSGKAWNPHDRKTSDYALAPCSANEQTGPQQFTVGLNGAGNADPGAAATAFAEVWRKRGHEVQQIGPTGSDPIKNTEMSVFLADGAVISYSVNTKVSSIDANSECSASPDVLKLAAGE